MNARDGLLWLIFHSSVVLVEISMCYSAISLFPFTIWLGYQCALFYWWLFPWHCINRNNLVENFALLFIGEGHEKRRNWLNSTISTMHFLVEFNHSNHSGFLNSITCWIQPIQPILSLMGVPEKTRLWVSPIFFSNKPLDQTLFLMKKFRKSKVTMFWKNWETMFFRQKPCWIG